MWKRIDHKHKTQNPAPRPGLRIYGWNGKLWPRLIISLATWPRRQPDEIKDGIKIYCEYKKRGDWWESVDIPKKLFPVLQELYEEVNE